MQRNYVPEYNKKKSIQQYFCLVLSLQVFMKINTSLSIILPFSMSLKLLILVQTVTLFITMSIKSVDGSAVLISDVTMTIMVELSSRHPFCKMHTDRYVQIFKKFQNTFLRICILKPFQRWYTKHAITSWSQAHT